MKNLYFSLLPDIERSKYKTEKQVWLEECLCEGCAEWKPCVMQLYPKPIIWRIVDFAKNNIKRDGK